MYSLRWLRSIFALFLFVVVVSFGSVSSSSSSHCSKNYLLWLPTNTNSQQTTQRTNQTTSNQTASQPGCQPQSCWPNKHQLHTHTPTFSNRTNIKQPLHHCQPSNQPTIEHHSLLKDMPAFIVFVCLPLLFKSLESRFLCLIFIIDIELC